MIPRATYRLQFHRDFTFADAQALVPYLDRLGISHVYASPITTARSGSTHGYDVVDPTRINPELGGEAAFRSLVATLRARGMGIIIDIVPNHMGVAGGENAWWNDVLRRGRESDYADFFDIDWQERLVLPILGAPLKEVLADGQIRVDNDGDTPFLSIYGEHRIPIRPEDHAAARSVDGRAVLFELIERQHYRLAWWRAANDELNWRRFFTINDLAGLRVEDAGVFEATHALYFRLFGEGMIDGVRIDHIDGLSDPAAYLHRLRERFDAISQREGKADAPAYIVVEKILAPGEALPSDWPIAGTSGYDFMADVTALLHDPAGEAPLSQLWQAMSGADGDFHEAELTARREMLSWGFSGQINGCVAAFKALADSSDAGAGITSAMLRRAIERAIWVFPVYRTYGPDAPPSDASVRDTVRERAARFTPPGEAQVLDMLLEWLAGEGQGDATLRSEAVRRFQQLSAPIAAKAVEDTAFYRYGRLLSLNDVGSDAGRFGMTPDAFFDTVAARAELFPDAMLTTATHDHKRGEDSRARLAVLSEVPDLWRQRVVGWEKMLGQSGSDVTPADRLMLYQALYAAMPDGLASNDRDGLLAFADRVSAWQIKALREGKRRSSWAAPDESYEARCTALIDVLLDPDRSSEFLTDLGEFIGMMAAPALAASLAQTGLRCLLPGIPDCYQGAELSDLSMVDPDNRRPVDYALRQAVLEGEAQAPGDAKLHLIRDLLNLRRDHADLFASGGMERLAVRGPRAGHVLAFSRHNSDRRLVAAVALHLTPELIGKAGPVADSGWWGDTMILSPGEETHLASAMFEKLPVFASVDIEQR
ncbi:malto-oligosyltrehalose synthase [Stakelama sp. CBK3Z-3]|uniref:Malto-oligosyltrehalose synthase n=1 Tax=Stakelama flava TaxID=2860338 RepID=A0ABS6XGJ7_9SPHN|nr:malto-oligosyltrehalose synthase [Stakelama flava]MBW4329271.1 malto-oligosyltrehalose synthase [Stakelama flava]